MGFFRDDYLLEEMAKELTDDWVRDKEGIPTPISDVTTDFIDRWYEARINGTDPKKPRGGSGSNSGSDGAKVVVFESSGDAADQNRSSSTGASSAKRASMLSYRAANEIRNYPWRVVPFFSPAVQTIANTPMRIK